MSLQAITVIPNTHILPNIEFYTNPLDKLWSWSRVHVTPNTMNVNTNLMLKQMSHSASQRPMALYQTNAELCYSWLHAAYSIQMLTRVTCSIVSEKHDKVEKKTKPTGTRWLYEKLFPRWQQSPKNLCNQKGHCRWMLQDLILSIIMMLVHSCNLWSLYTTHE